MCEAWKARYYYYRGRDNFSETYQSAFQRIKAAEMSDDDNLIPEALYAMGRFLFLNGSYYESLDYFLQLLEMNLTTDMRVTLFYTLGQVYSLIHEGDIALIERYYDLAEAEMQKDDFTNTSIKGFILFGRGNLFVPSSDKELFEFHPLSPSRVDSLQKAVAILEEAVKISPSSVAYSALLISHAFLGEVEQSRYFEQKALDMAASNPEALGVVYYAGAVARYREKRFGDAIALSTQGMESSLSKRDWQGGIKNMKVIYHAGKATGDTRQALYFHEQIAMLSDSIMKREKQEQVMLNQVKYDTLLKDEQLKEARRRHQAMLFRNRIFGTVGLVFIVLSIILLRLYLQKQRAYRDLVRKNRQWANQYALETVEKPETSNHTPERRNEPDDNEHISDSKSYAIVEQVHQMLLGGLYQDDALDIDRLSEQTGFRKKTLSNAINRITGKNFNRFINEYRIKEALRIMTNTEEVRFKELYQHVGFNSYTAFYRTFRQVTGLHPRQFKDYKTTN